MKRVSHSRFRTSKDTESTLKLAFGEKQQGRHHHVDVCEPIMIVKYDESQSLVVSLMTQHLTNFYRIVDSQEFDSSIIYLSAESPMPLID